MYSSVKEADSYISTHYTSKSAAYKRWNALSEDDKAVCLNNAFDSIECLKFGGRKAVPNRKPLSHACRISTDIQTRELLNV